MAITACREVWRGETWSDSKDGSREYLMIFEVLSDDPSESPLTVRNHPDIPSRLSSYPDDTDAVCIDRNGRRDEKSRLLWLVECQFAWGPGQAQEEEDVNPLDRFPQIRWTSQTIMVPAIKDKNGDAIVNSAGDYFDPPPEIQRERWVANIQFNATEIPANIRQYKGAVNNSAVTIDNEAVASERAKIIGLDISEKQYWQLTDDTTVLYRAITLAVEIRDDDDDSFDLELLDQGLRINVAGVMEDVMIEPDGGGEPARASAPVLLDGSGVQLINPGTTTAVFLTFEIANLRDITIFPGIEAA